MARIFGVKPFSRTNRSLRLLWYNPPLVSGEEANITQGNVTLNLKSKDLVLGYAQIQNFVIKPGNNTFALSGRLDIRKILQNLPEVISAQRDAIMTGEIELLATGNKTVYEGQQIPYYEQVLNGLTLTARVPILGVLIDTLKGLGGGNGSLWKNIGNIGNGGGSLSGLLDGL